MVQETDDEDCIGQYPRHQATGPDDMWRPLGPKNGGLQVWSPPRKYRVFSVRFVWSWRRVEVCRVCC